MAAIYEIFNDRQGRFRFWLIAADGKLLLTSKAYDTRRACQKAIASARKNASTRQRFVQRKAEDGKNYFILKAANNRSLGKSTYYSSNESLYGAIELIRKHGSHCPVNDLTRSWH